MESIAISAWWQYWLYTDCFGLLVTILLMIKVVKLFFRGQCGHYFEVK